MFDVIFHTVISVEGIIVTYLFFSVYLKTRDRNMLVLAIAFLILGAGYALHIYEDFFRGFIQNGAEAWFFEHIDHISLIIVLTAFIWVVWPRTRWSQELKSKRSH